MAKNLRIPAMIVLTSTSDDVEEGIKQFKKGWSSAKRFVSYYNLWPVKDDMTPKIDIVNTPMFVINP